MFTFLKSFLKYCGVCVILLLLLEVYYLTSLKNTTLTNSKFQGDASTKYILYWTPFWDRRFSMDVGKETFKTCEYSNCLATNNRSLIPLKKFDAILFDFHFFEKQHGRPWERSPHQKYVFMNNEPPVHRCPNLKRFSSFYNWTMTYRTDSDIVRKFGYYRKRQTGYQVPGVDVFNKKTKFAAWFESLCKTQSKIEKLVDTLSEFKAIDLFGKCRSQPWPRESLEECYDMAAEEYFFCLSLEHSLCIDYVSDTLYELLKRDIVPVVYGGGNYETMAPPGSVIDISSFSQLEDILVYLEYLSNDSDAYLKYFEWKKQYYIDTTNEMYACELCKKLHTESNKTTIYEDLDEWWWGPSRSICFT